MDLCIGQRRSVADNSAGTRMSASPLKADMLRVGSDVG